MNDDSHPKTLVNLSKHPLLQQAYDLVQAIETLPASVEQTFVVTKASRLLDFIECYFEEKGFPSPPPEEIEEEEDPTCGGMLSECEQCGETAWDGRICHACGMKEI